jgi:predicted enzyme related to lactoylglutathione lyase
MMVNTTRVVFRTVIFVGGDARATRGFFSLAMDRWRERNGAVHSVQYLQAPEAATPQAGCWVPCFATSDKVETMHQVVEHGAKLATSLTVDGSDVDMFAAPDGVLFAVVDMTASHSQSWSLGQVAFVDLYTPRAEEAAAYYATTLSCTVVHESEPTPGDYRFLVSHDEPVAGVVDMLDVLPAAVPPHWIPYWRVPDLDAEVARLSDFGARVRVPATDSALGPFALLSDPYGVTFGLQTPDSDVLLVEHARAQTQM